MTRQVQIKRLIGVTNCQFAVVYSDSKYVKGVNKYINSKEVTRITVNINSKLLKWAREERGFSSDEICKKLKIDAKRYQQWELDGKDIPFTKLKSIAQQYKRQLAIFFLPEIPPKNKKPKDYRNLTDNNLSKQALLVLRRVNHYRNLSLDLEGKSFWQARYKWLDKVRSSNNIEVSLRGILGIDLQAQLNFQSPAEAYKNWRNAIEKNLGIHVFQFSMPLSEIQGFCYSDFLPYCIVVNSKHSYAARIFTLFHELGHIIKHQSGICLPDQVQKDQTVEFRCNEFAADFLLPKKVVIPTSNLEEIKRYANQYKVSREVYVRRLFEMNLISKPTFFNLLNKIIQSYKDIKPSKGFVKPTVKSKAERGETFYNLIFESLSNNKIKYTEASEALGLTIKTILREV